MKILITRAAKQAITLKSMVEENQHQALMFPVLEIKPITAKPLKTHYHAVIFTSPNAVDCALKIFKKLDLNNTIIFAIGAGSANKLQSYGLNPINTAIHAASSEKLLASPELSALQHKNILIIKGKGGRKLLKTALIKNNHVECLDVYQRAQHPITALHIRALTTFLVNDNAIITITSIDILDAFINIISAINLCSLDKIKKYPIIVFSKRIAEYAQNLGFNNISITNTTSDDGIIKAINLDAKAIS